MEIPPLPLEFTARLFDPLGDVLFCVKDDKGRYTAVNPAFLARTGLKREEEALGKTASDLFPRHLSETYEAQDAEVRQTRAPISARLERITNEDGSIGWYLAHKFPIPGPSENVLGLVALSQDLNAPTDTALRLSNLARAVAHIRENLDSPLRSEDLAAIAQMSSPQFERRMKRVFRLSSTQFVIQTRIEEASRRLAESEQSISEIALDTGFADQSALTRQFKSATGYTPAEFRRQHRSSSR